MNNFKKLNKTKHNRNSFDCGLEAANNFLQLTAYKDQVANASSTWVLPVSSNPSEIAAFYSLAPHHIGRDSHREFRRQSRDQVPVLILPWLAVDQRFRHHGFGVMTLVTALRHAFEIMNREDGMGVGLVLDAYDEKALQWYLSMEWFDVIGDGGRTLYISYKSLRKAREEGRL